MTPLWPHQQYGLQRVLEAIEQGYRRILVTSPTGGGKTRMMTELLAEWDRGGLRCSLYTNRKMLLEQTHTVLNEAGIDHGVRASGWSDEGKHWPIQLSSIHTEHSRVFQRGEWGLHEADRIIIDEAHLQKEAMMQKALDAHHAEGAAYVGFTATPLDLAGLYDLLVVAGTNSELRQCGALVPARHYGCDEPDLRSLGYLAPGQELSEKQARSAMMRSGIFGRVIEWFRILNPEGRPTILFAPGVPESVWFAEQFCAAGVPAAHIDGQEVWIDGEWYRNDWRMRQRVIEASRDGSIKVLCNRFVLREGIDAPWLSHGIFATVFGSVQSYLQSGGRLLRSHPGVGHVTVQDHGGNWWRHGSLNADRQWSLELTSSIAAGMREDRLRNKLEPEPLRCPKCATILNFPKCPCGWEPAKGWKKSRPVVQSDGTLREMTGDIYKRRPVCKRSDGPARWEKMYWRSRTEKGKRSFRAAMALFARENNWQWPDPTWPFMPLDYGDQFRDVIDVPMHKLVPKE